MDRKSGLLKKSIVPSSGRKPHLELFLVKDNKDALLPKNLLQTKLVKMKNEEEYDWIDEKGAGKIQKYKISAILKGTLTKPIKSRKIYFKSTHPLFLIRE